MKKKDCCGREVASKFGILLGFLIKDSRTPKAVPAIE